jgi:hypothetical protein
LIVVAAATNITTAPIPSNLLYFTSGTSSI